jgi:hypothetical protein
MTGLGYLIPIGQEIHPAIIDVFSDSGSLLHVGLGAAMAYIDPPWRGPVLASFIGYQVSQAQSGESWSRTGGEFFELALGMVLGYLARGET